MDFNDLANTIDRWVASGALAKTGGHIAVAAIIVGGGFFVAQLFRSAIRKLRGGFGSVAPVAYVVEQLGAYAIIVVGVVSGAATLGLDLSSLALFGGAVGVGVGLGLQGVVKEFVSGIVLIFDPTVQVGDFVELDGGVRGEVVEIGPRAVRMRTNDDLNVIVPNSAFMQCRLTNWTYNSVSRRIHVPFSVAEESDVAQVREIVLGAARELPFTLPEDDLHRTQVWLNGFAGAGLDFDLVVWPTLESSRHPRTLHAAYTWAIYQALQAAGIRNAQDQMDVRFQSAPHAGPQMPWTRRKEKAATSAAAKATPNDAATAVYEEADRRRIQREEAPRTREAPSSQTPRP